MVSQDRQFNNNFLIAALAAIILGILIAFYYSYAQSKSQIYYLQEEKALLMRDLTLVNANIDRLEARNLVDEIEIQRSKRNIQELMDSVGRLNFSIQKLKEFKTELQKLKSKNDSLRLRNNYLKYDNSIVTEQNKEFKKVVEKLNESATSSSKLESLKREKRNELNQELKVKRYLNISSVRAGGLRIKSNKPIQTNKASVIEKLEGCAIVQADSLASNTTKVLYFQFLNPNMQIIADNANTINVNGNIYSKRILFPFSGKQTEICNFITLPEGSLVKGNYTLNVFENEKLLSTSEFELK